MPNSHRKAATSLVVLPVFNERRYVDDIMRAVAEYSDHILVVDDGSTDGTSEMLARRTEIEVISHGRNQGYGQSLIEGFGFARRHGFDWMITLDCDHQHEPSFIPRFHSEIENDDADVISGSRYLRPVGRGSAAPPAERVAINRRITNILNENLGTRLTDAFCGFKAYRVEAVLKLGLTETGYALPLQLWVRAARKGLRITEIPVPLIYHDPKRKFCGDLEDPKKRFDYYIRIIERELDHNVRPNLTEALHS